MAKKTWKLIDLQQNLCHQRLTIGPDDVAGAADGYRVSAERLQAGLSQGVDTVHIDNGSFAFTVLPTRGMGVWKAWSGKDFPVGWNSPVRGPVHPQFVPLTEPGGLGWLDGFDELLCRCGLESNGAPDFDEVGRLTYPLHGRIANRPAHRVEVQIDGETGEITLTGVVEETRFHFQKLRLTTTIQTKVGEPGFRVHDEVENFSGSPSEMQLLYHINFGPPLLGPGAQAVAPLKKVVPRDARAAEGIEDWQSYQAAEPGSIEQVYFCQLASQFEGQTRTLLKNEQASRGVSLHFNTRQLPCYTVWKNTTSEADGYVTGLEPGTNFPNPRAFETQHGRLVVIQPGGKECFDVALEVHRTAAEVAAAEQAVAEMQAAAEPQIFNDPQPDWCAGAG